jgi:hypothetical protein
MAEVKKKTRLEKLQELRKLDPFSDEAMQLREEIEPVEPEQLPLLPKVIASNVPKEDTSARDMFIRAQEARKKAVKEYFPDSDEAGVLKKEDEKPQEPRPLQALREAAKEEEPSDAARPTVLDSSSQKTTTKQTTMGPGTLRKPGDVDKFWDDVQAKANALPKEDRSVMDREAGELNKLQQQVLATYKQNRKDTKMLQLAEMLGHAMTQLGAGLQGMRTGVDLSGLKFNKADWKADYDANVEELKAQLSDIKERRGELSDTRKQAAAKEEATRNQYVRGRFGERAQELEDYNRQELERLKGSQRQEISAEEQASREAIARERAAGKGSGAGEDKNAKALDLAIQKADAVANAKNSKEAIKAKEELSEALGKAGIRDLTPPGKDDIGSWWEVNKPNQKEAYTAFRDKLKARAGGGQPPAAEQKAAATKSTVRIQAPDGTVAEVPREKAQKYIDKGGKLVQ